MGTSFKDDYIALLSKRTKEYYINKNTTRITTPLLDKNNDAIEVYVIQNGNHIKITDDGYIMNDLDISGLTIEKNTLRDRYLQNILSNHGVELGENNELMVNADTSNYSIKMYLLTQCMSKVSELHVLSKPNAKSLFSEDVKKYLVTNDIRFIENPFFIGKSKLTTQFDFAIPRFKDAPERIIKVTSNIKMPAVAELGDSKNLQVGDSVVAIGNPLGKELLGSVTTGVVSALNRDVKVNNTTHTYIQTDAAINSGNSGGALVNSAGQVIGINSAKISGSGVEGIGFAIPIDTVKPKLSGLLKPILKLGIAARDITSQLSEQYNVPEGVYVAEVQEFSAAEKCGLQVGDVIQKFDGKSIKTVEEINQIKSTHNSGDTVAIVVYRNGNTKTLQLTLTE